MKTLIKVLNNYASRYMSTRVVFILDMLMSLTASLIAVLLVKLFVSIDMLNTILAFTWLASSFLVSFFLIWAFRTYRIIIRHMSLKDFAKFGILAFTKTITLGFIYVLIYGVSNELAILVVCDFFLTFGAFFALRVMMLILYDYVKGLMNERKKCQNILVYGVGTKSVSLLQRLSKSPNYNIVGFIQYGKNSISHIISGVNVYYVVSAEELRNVVKRRSADAILFASEKEARMESERIIKYALDCGLKLLFAPAIDEMVDGKPVHSLRNIEIEDLLMRPEIKISMDEIIANFKDKTVMVTGAAGSIGSELARQLASFGVKELVLFDNAETPMHNLRLELEDKFPELRFIPIIGDVRQISRLDYVFSKCRPQIVFHAAAYKHVPLMEMNPCEAVLVNVAGSRNVADKCIEYDVEKMVMISTDKAVNPTNIMGCTKRLAEIYVQSMGLAMEHGLKAGRTRFVTTRFGNVLGSNGSVIPRFREQIAKGGPVTVTHPEITRFFMTIPEACRLVMEAATMSTGNQIFVFDMGESVKIDDLARRMIHLAGYKPDVDIKIEYTGLRPGEKLYEEVLSNSENTLPTDHSHIRIAKVREYDYNDALKAVDTLESLSHGDEVPQVVKLMKQVVPEFISNNSWFDIYDSSDESANVNS